MSAHKMGELKVWDCGSSLYDSLELKSFNYQLDLAIAKSRLNSMPQPSEPVYTYPLLPPKKSYISKLFSSVFKKLNISCKKSFVVEYENVNGGYLSSYGVANIRDESEKGFESLNLDRKVRKTVSERYTSSSSARIHKLLHN